MTSGSGAVYANANSSLGFNGLPVSQQANKITVQGSVVDAKGEPLIGVSILEKGTTNGTITDFDGNFTKVSHPQ